MKKLLLALSLFIATPAFADNVEIVWTPPTTNADNSPLTDLASYNLYISSTSGSYTSTPFATFAAGSNDYTFTYPTVGTFYLVLTAVNSYKQESAPSNEVSFVIKPGIPTAIIDLRIVK